VLVVTVGYLYGTTRKRLLLLRNLSVKLYCVVTMDRNRGRYTQKDWQLDLPFANGKFGVLPKFLPGRVNVDDFVFFDYPSSFNPNDYEVSVTTLDTTNPYKMTRTIGPLQKNVELPFVYYDAYGTIYVQPRSDRRLPTYYARLNRGSTYVILEPAVPSVPPVKYEMRRHGMLTAGADSSKLAY
jgi:hypothetical protein